MAKLKSARDLAGSLLHNTREVIPMNADPNRVHLNIDLLADLNDKELLKLSAELKDKNNSGKFLKGSENAMSAYKTLRPEKIRKDAVHAVETLISLTDEQWEQLGSGKGHNYFIDSLKWTAKKFGGEKNLLSAFLHFDESGPHLHIHTLPLLDGKFNCKAYIGGKKFEMGKMQDDFYETVAKKYGLDRGEKNTGLKHQETSHFKEVMKEKTAELDTRESLLNDKEEKLGADYGEYLDKIAELEGDRLRFDVDSKSLDQKFLVLEKREKELKEKEVILKTWETALERRENFLKTATAIQEKKYGKDIFGVSIKLANYFHGLDKSDIDSLNTQFQAMADQKRAEKELGLGGKGNKKSNEITPPPPKKGGRG